MKKVDIKKLAGVGTLSLGLVLGMAGFAGAQSGMIDTTGPYSENEIEYESDMELDVDNRNDLDLTNTSVQTAESGETSVMYNTTGGDAMTGDASNSNSVSAHIELDNSQSVAAVSEAVAWDGGGSASASIENTGPYSENEVSYESDVDIDIENDNDVEISNTVSQTATSGDAHVQYNTTGGDAVSGSVSNSSSSSFTVQMTN